MNSEQNKEITNVPQFPAGAAGETEQRSTQKDSAAPAEAGQAADHSGQAAGRKTGSPAGNTGALTNAACKPESTPHGTLPGGALSDPELAPAYIHPDAPLFAHTANGRPLQTDAAQENETHSSPAGDGSGSSGQTANTGGRQGNAPPEAPHGIDPTELELAPAYFICSDTSPFTHAVHEASPANGSNHRPDDSLPDMPPQEEADLAEMKPAYAYLYPNASPFAQTANGGQNGNGNQKPALESKADTSSDGSGKASAMSNTASASKDSGSTAGACGGFWKNYGYTDACNRMGCLSDCEGCGNDTPAKDAEPTDALGHGWIAYRAGDLLKQRNAAEPSGTGAANPPDGSDRSPVHTTDGDADIAKPAGGTTDGRKTAADGDARPVPPNGGDAARHSGNAEHETEAVITAPAAPNSTDHAHTSGAAVRGTNAANGLPVSPNGAAAAQHSGTAVRGDGATAPSGGSVQHAEPASTPSPEAAGTAGSRPAAPGSDGQDTEALRAEVTRLRAELELQRQLSARYARDCEEFRQLYPDVPLSALPESIWEEVRQGVPLPAAYALAERRRTRTQEIAQEANRLNRMRSAGSAGQPPPSYFSPDEVRAMSAEEVRQNYRTILQSMQKWS